MALEFHVVIPARYASSRLPGKMLAPIGGRPMIQWVWERAMASGANSVLIGTDDERIAQACRAFGAECEMTSAAHASGTDRVAEVTARKRFDAADIIVNVQGDEPMIPPQLVRQVAQCLHESPHAQIATAVTPLSTLAEFRDPNCVKAIRACDGRALYFTRAPAPWPRDAMSEVPAEAWRHIGIYAYRAGSLARLAAFAPTPLERCERLEQLRALEHGLCIQLSTCDKPPPPGIDTPEDLAACQALVAAGGVAPHQ